ncbi:CaiB/BaiF CoA transferase family protein [Mycobacterium xenopi]|uniref:CoA transferase n=1 Tax=Mycobacterium xenopi TaxID=1789 RepID=A0AAD1LZM7_MYCXE|nr:CaiB/BaiF CoA-transferase family protein [Mycobacterium xenopi]MDA3639652.1 CaiB/BaiF CoA-transferase family protein [Mycobacterium xenopi]MDA3657902.1 CaiB/BaiF CoA-transferase family protein [Mycobacterium xenopi]MDA3663581.1 CaiB/BaiF CoA-transferase family protein [Mycobacterium xenopi]ORX21194.1 carnitine dehydratase [Mycobacterium xenopi]SPX79015.1 L-carnitine dehydratase/bile acid-inducible protein F [Mycobacterium xenopi]
MTRTPNPAQAPLSGLTVVSLEQAVAAPYATRQLADLGARVIKVERPDGGDFARGYDRSVNGESSYFVWLNRGKESLTLDLKHTEGQRILHRLLTSADVLVQNLGPGAAARMGLDAATVARRYPRLIVCDITGYGTTGPWCGRKAYDLLVQAEAGLLSVTGNGDQVARTGISIADIAAGMFAYSGILMALLVRTTTGRVAPVSVSLFEALAEWMGQPAYYAHYGGTPPLRTGARHATIAPYGPFTTGDGGTVLLAVQNEREWQRLCGQVLGLPGLLTDSRFATNSDRVANRDLVEEEIQAATATMTADELAGRLETAGIAYGHLTGVESLWSHPVLLGRDRWGQILTPGGTIGAMLPPTLLGGIEPVLGNVPALGAHSHAILQELGCSDDAIHALAADGVITLG